MEIKRQIIVIPGVMGSVLKKGHYPIWPIPFINNILKPYEHLKDIKDEGVYARKIEPFTYKKLIRKLKEHTPHVTEFFYDWRQNNLSHLSLLEEKIMKDADEIIFVAHSMGGIITKLFLNHFSEEEFISKVSKVITLGTPWYGSLVSYKALKYGSRVPDEKKTINGYVLSDLDSKSISPYFPSTYQLLPSAKYFSSSQSLETEALITYNIKSKEYSNNEDFFNDHLKQTFEQLDHDYQEIMDDYKELLLLPFPENIVHSEIIGNGTLTLSGISENSLGEADGDYRNGDGTVPVFSALSNPENTYFINNVEHSQLPKNDNVIRLISHILSSHSSITVDNPQIFTSLASANNKKINGKLVKIACPVTASIIDSEGEVIYGAIETVDEEHLEKLSKNNFDIHILGNTTYLFIDNEEEDFSNLNNVIINAYDKGPTTITIDLLEEGQYTKRNSFKTFEINPNMKATIKISELLEESKVTIENIEHEEKEDLSSIILENRSTPNSITTNLEFDNSKVKNIKDNIYVTKSTIEFKFSHSSTTDAANIDETFVSINNEILMVKNNVLRRELIPGEYSIQYFSKDIFGNVESVNEIKLIVLPDKLIKYTLDFYPQYYKIKYEFNSIYENCLSIIEEGNYKHINLEFEGQSIDESTFTYEEHDKMFKLSYIDLFNENIIEELPIDENLILQFFEGNANEQNLNDIMNKYSILNKDVKFESDHYIRSRTAINNENIKNSTIIRMRNPYMEITINKETEYEIYFLNLSEDINLGLEDVYELMFKVLIKGENIEQKDLNLIYTAQMKFNNQIIPLEDQEVVFDGHYTAKINLKTIREKTEGYWTKNQIINFDISIINKDDNNVIRVQDFIIR